MKKKAVFTLLATGLFLFSLWIAALGFSCLQSDEKRGDVFVLAIEKNRAPGPAQLAFIKPPYSDPEESRAGDVLLAGMLMVFIAASAAGAGFVCHLLRGDDSAA